MASSVHSCGFSLKTLAIALLSRTAVYQMLQMPQISYPRAPIRRQQFRWHSRTSGFCDMSFFALSSFNLALFPRQGISSELERDSLLGKYGDCSNCTSLCNPAEFGSQSFNTNGDTVFLQSNAKRRVSGQRKRDLQCWFNIFCCIVGTNFWGREIKGKLHPRVSATVALMLSVQKLAPGFLWQLSFWLTTSVVRIESFLPYHGPMVVFVSQKDTQVITIHTAIWAISQKHRDTLISRSVLPWKCVLCMLGSILLRRVKRRGTLADVKLLASEGLGVFVFW